MDWKRVSSKKTGEPLSSREKDSCFYDKIPAFVAVHGVLPIECMECYKVIISAKELVPVVNPVSIKTWINDNDT
jgi:hypothetical protein